MSARARSVLGAGAVLLVMAGIGFIDALPTVALVVIAAVMAVGSIVAWVLVERRIDREAGVR